MTNTMKLVTAAALVAATSMPAFAQSVPLNTTVSGTAGAEKTSGQASGALSGGLSGMTAISGLTVLTSIASTTSSTN